MKKELHKIIQEKFRRSRYSNVKEWHMTTKCPLSAFTCTKIINQSVEPSLETAIVMLHLLDTPNTELIKICKDHGDNVFWRTMSGCDVSAAEMVIIEALRKAPEKAEIVKSILAL